MLNTHNLRIMHKYGVFKKGKAGDSYIALNCLIALLLGIMVLMIVIMPKKAIITHKTGNVERIVLWQ